MRIVDANVLIYAANDGAPNHERARNWLDQALSGAEPVIIPWLCLVAFVRICTLPTKLSPPMTTDEAMDTVEAWLGAPPVRTDLPAGQIAPTLRGLLSHTGSAGDLVNDAWLAALAVTLGADIVSFDSDFRRFPGVRWIQP